MMWAFEFILKFSTADEKEQKVRNWTNSFLDNVDITVEFF